MGRIEEIGGPVRARPAEAELENTGEPDMSVEWATPEKCGDLMTKDPVCCQWAETVRHAARLMRDTDVGGLPVVETPDNNVLVGFVTDRDLALEVVAEERDADGTSVEEVMSRDLVTCSPEEPVEEALNAMRRRQVRRVVVVDARNRVVGVIALADVALRLRDEAVTADLAETISKPKAAFGR